jgi:hypothetical protein
MEMDGAEPGDPIADITKGYCLEVNMDIKTTRGAALNLSELHLLNR